MRYGLLFRALAVAPGRGFVLVPESPVHLFVAWVGFDGQVRGGRRVFEKGELPEALAVDGDWVLAYTREAKLHRFGWEELFAEEQR